MVRDDAPELDDQPSRRSRLPSRRSLLLGVLVFLVCGTLLAPYMFVTVPAGSTGVIWRRFAGGTDVDTRLTEGIQVIWPWDKVHLYDLRLQSDSIEIVALTRDGLNVTIAITFRWFINPEHVGWLHKLIGPEYLHLLLRPEMNASTRREFAKFATTDYYGFGREKLTHDVYGAVVDSKNPNYIYPAGTTGMVGSAGTTAALEKAIKVEDGLVALSDVLIKDIILPPRVVAAIQSKIEQEQLAKEMVFRVERERFESERKVVEAEGIKKFQEIVQAGISETYLKWRGIEATVMLATSPNAKTVVIGGGNGGLPMILNTGDSATPQHNAAPPSGQPPAASPPSPSVSNLQRGTFDPSKSYAGSVDVSRPEFVSQFPSSYSLGAPNPMSAGAWSRDVTLGARSVGGVYATGAADIERDFNRRIDAIVAERAEALKNGATISQSDITAAPASAPDQPTRSTPGAASSAWVWGRLNTLMGSPGWFGGAGNDSAAKGRQ